MDSNPDFEIERASELPEEIGVLVEESAAEGFAFVKRLRDEWSAGTNRFDHPGEVFLIARSKGRLVGVCGLNRDPFVSDASVGRLRRLYVLPSARRLGIARALTQLALRAARQSFSVVRLRTFASEASAFYRTLGFVAIDDDPDASHEFRFDVDSAVP